MLFLVAVLVFMPHIHVKAEENAVIDILPAANSGQDMAPSEETVTHQPLRLTPDKSELIRLDEEAGSVILGNPEHATILAESATLLVVVPKKPGATYFTILSKDGSIVMQRHVIVGSPKENYVRVRKSCIGTKAAADDSCNDTNVYYCPDMCHNIDQPTEQEASQNNENKDDNSKNDDSNSSYSQAPGEPDE